MKNYITIPAIEISINDIGYSGTDPRISLDPDTGVPDIGDEGRAVEENYSESHKEFLISTLTNRQQQVAGLLFDGYARPDIAARLNPPVCVQAVHQIILRIRKRLNKKAGIKMQGRHIHNGIL